MSKVLAVILAGGQGERLSLLSQKRAKPAVPFAGKYRIIDFALSNCVNSGITDVAVLTQYRPHSLHDHIGIGKPWDLDRQKGGVRLLQPYRGHQESEWYQGTADAVRQQIRYVHEDRCSDVLILSGDQLYRMDFAKLLQTHQETSADVTIAVLPVAAETAPGCGIMRLDDAGRRSVSVASAGSIRPSRRASDPFGARAGNRGAGVIDCSHELSPPAGGTAVARTRAM